MRDRFQMLVEKWPSPWVARTEVAKFSGGAICGKTISNMAHLGKKTPKAFRVGNKIVYEAEALVDFLRSISERGQPS